MRPFATFCLALPLLVTATRFVLIFKCNVLENVNVVICLFLRKKQDSVEVKTVSVFIDLHQDRCQPEISGGGEGQTKRRKLVKI